MPDLATLLDQQNASVQPPSGGPDLYQTIVRQSPWVGQALDSQGEFHRAADFVAERVARGVHSYLGTEGHSEGGLLAGERAWPVVEAELRSRFPGVEPQQLRDAYEQALAPAYRAARLQSIRQQHQSADLEDASDYWIQRTPFFGPVLSLAEQTRQARAVAHIQAGTASDDEYQDIGRHLARLDRNERAGFGGHVLDLLTQAPGFLAEMYLTGGIFTAGKAAASRAIGRVAGEEALARFAERAALRAAGEAVPRTLGEVAYQGAERTLPYLAGTAAQSAATPSLTLANAGQQSAPQVVVGGPRGVENVGGQGDWYSPQNLLRGQAAGMIQAGAYDAAAFLPGGGGAGRRLVYQGVLAPIAAQRGSEVALGATGLAHDYGTAGLLWEGLRNVPSQGLGNPQLMQALQHTAEEAVAFGLIHGAHRGIERGADWATRRRYSTEYRDQPLGRSASPLSDAGAEYLPRRYGPDEPFGPRRPEAAPEPTPQAAPTAVPQQLEALHTAALQFGQHAATQGLDPVHVQARLVEEVRRLGSPDAVDQARPTQAPADRYARAIAQAMYGPPVTPPEAPWAAQAAPPAPGGSAPAQQAPVVPGGQPAAPPAAPQGTIPGAGVVRFVPHENSRGRVLVEVDPRKLDAAWRQDVGYLPEGSGGASEVPGRRQQFLQWMFKNEPVQAPLVQLHNDGVAFEDGRHRFAVLRDVGIDRVAVMVPEGEAAAFGQRFAPGPRAEPPAALGRATSTPPLPADYVAHGHAALGLPYTADPGVSAEAHVRALAEAEALLPEGARALVRKHLRGYHFAEDQRSLGRQVADDVVGNDPESRSNERWRKTYRDSTEATYGSSYGGWDDRTGKLYLTMNPEEFQHLHKEFAHDPPQYRLDTSSPEAAARGLYLHEFAHAADGPGFSLTNVNKSDAWFKVWHQELADGQLTRYGATSAREGFAELFRVLNSGGPGAASAAGEFPAATAFLREHGLAPKLGAGGVVSPQQRVEAMRRRQQGLAPVPTPTVERGEAPLSRQETAAERHFAEVRYEDIPDPLRQRVEALTAAGREVPEAIRERVRVAYASNGDEGVQAYLSAEAIREVSARVYGSKQPKAEAAFRKDAWDAYEHLGYDGLSSWLRDVESGLPEKMVQAKVTKYMRRGLSRAAAEARVLRDTQAEAARAEDEAWDQYSATPAIAATDPARRLLALAEQRLAEQRGVPAGSTAPEAGTPLSPEAQGRPGEPGAEPGTAAGRGAPGEPERLGGAPAAAPPAARLPEPGPQRPGDRAGAPVESSRRQIGDEPAEPAGPVAAAGLSLPDVLRRTRSTARSAEAEAQREGLDPESLHRLAAENLRQGADQKRQHDWLVERALAALEHEGRMKGLSRPGVLRELRKALRASDTVDASTYPGFDRATHELEGEARQYLDSLTAAESEQRGHQVNPRDVLWDVLREASSTGWKQKPLSEARAYELALDRLRAHGGASFDPERGVLVDAAGELFQKTQKAGEATPPNAGEPLWPGGMTARQFEEERGGRVQAVEPFGEGLHLVHVEEPGHIVSLHVYQGRQELGEVTVSHRAVQNARSTFPEQMPPGAVAYRLQAIELNGRLQGQGLGKQLILKVLDELPPGTRLWNSQLSSQAQKVLESLRRSGQIEYVPWEESHQQRAGMNALLGSAGNSSWIAWRGQFTPERLAPEGVSPEAPQEQRALPAEPRIGAVARDVETGKPTVLPADMLPVAKGILREAGAERQRAGDVAARRIGAALNHYNDTIRPLSAPADRAQMVERFLEVVEPREQGRLAYLTDDVLRKGLHEVADLIAEREPLLRELNLVEHFQEHYLGRLWKDPAHPEATVEEIGARINSRRTLAGTEGFRKQQVLPTFRDGFEAGLEPVTWNPYEMQLLKLREIDHSIYGHRAFNDTIAEGIFRYVRLGAKAPAGFQQVPDRLATVLAPPETKVREFIDKRQMEGLEKFARDLGVDLRRVTSGPAGSYSPGSETITTRFGTPEETLAHEIGHALDRKFDLRASWAQNPSLRPELLQLADLRASGRADPEHQAYLRSEPELIANLVAAYVHAPELLKETAPNAHHVLDSFLASHELTRPLRDIKPSLELAHREQLLRLAGPMLVGHYYGPREVVSLYQRFLSEGLAGRDDLAGKVYDLARGAGNTLNLFNMGFSGWHAVGTALNVQFSAMALGLKMASRGELLRGALQFGKGLVPGLTWFKAAMEGLKAQREWYAPGSQGAATQEAVRNIVMAGGRAGMDSFLQTSHLKSMVEAIKDLRAGQYRRAAQGSWLGLRAAAAIAEVFSKPTMQYWVPMAKFGVALERMNYELEWMARKGIAATPNELRVRLGKIWDSVDNRLGQLAYDNLFWHRTVKDLAMVSIRAVGWNLGTWRELGGAVRDLPASVRGLRSGEGISDRAAYALSLVVGSAAMGALTQLLLTGEYPQELKDYLFPRTGRTRKDGSADRLSFPTYLHHDVAPLFNRADEGPLRIAQNAYRSATAKENPVLSQTHEMLANEDFYGAAIRNPQDPILVQTRDTLMHLVGALEPFSVRTARRTPGTTPGQWAGSMAGITPAPSWAVHTWEEQRRAEAARRIQMTPLERRRRGLR